MRGGGHLFPQSVGVIFLGSLLKGCVVGHLRQGRGGQEGWIRQGNPGADTLLGQMAPDDGLSQAENPHRKEVGFPSAGSSFFPYESKKT